PRPDATPCTSARAADHLSKEEHPGRRRRGRAHPSASPGILPWKARTVFHGIEGLRKAGNGYVYWRGIRVDHYSFPDDEAGERAAAQELAEQCRHLEALGVSVRRVGDFSWFAGMTTVTPTAYRTFVGGANNFLEHPDGSLAWQFVHDNRVKGAEEDTEIEAVY